MMVYIQPESVVLFLDSSAGTILNEIAIYGKLLKRFSTFIHHFSSQSVLNIFEQAPFYKSKP